MVNNSIRFTVSRITTAKEENILEVISDWKNLPLYWHGMRKIMKGEDDVLIVKFAFPGRTRMRYVLDLKMKISEELYLSGPFTGFKRLSIHSGEGDNSEITALWEINLSSFLSIARNRMMVHLKTGTEHALERISEEAERMGTSIN